MNPLRRRESGIRSVTAALHLKNRGVRYFVLARITKGAAVAYGEWSLRSVDHFELTSGMGVY